MQNRNRVAKVHSPRIIEEHEELERDTPSQHDTPDDAAEQSYSAFISGFSEAKGCHVKVHRQTPRGRQYCFTGTPEEIRSEETIRIFHSKQPYAHEDGLYYLSVEVNGQLRSCFPVNIAPQAAAADNSPGQHMSGGMAEMLRMIQAQNERLERMLMENGRREPTPMLEVVEGLQRLDQLRGGAQAQQLPMDVMIRAIELGQKLSSAGVPTEDWTSLFRDVLKENMPVILPLLTKMFMQQPQPPQNITPPVKAGVIEERKEVPVMPDEETQLQEALKQAISFLKRKAERNSDPGLYVDMIMDNREDPLYARLISDILEKDFSAFASIDPEIAGPKYSGFFGFIYNGIRSIFDQQNSMASVSNGKDGNKTNAPVDGGSGKKSSK